MKFKILFLILIIGFSNIALSQNLSSIFTNIDTLYIPGAVPGHISPLNANVTAIVSSSPCENPLLNFAVATEHQSGRVIAIGHEGILSNNNYNQSDNLQFLIQAMNWLNSTTKRVTLKEGWIDNFNSSAIQSELIGAGYTFNAPVGSITAAALSNTDILILGNDWNGTQPYSAAELTVLDNFVSNGSSIFIAGLGWSWPQNLNLYPMNQVANLFDFEYTTDAIYDQIHNVNGSPKLYNFYPDNASTVIPYCPSPYLNKNFKRGDTLRVLRLAVSTNGEFTQENGGASAIPQLLEDWLETINDIYGREFAIRFELIPNNDLLIFSDPATDPWQTLPPGSGGCTNAGLILNDQVQVIDSIIGDSNYDISHVVAGSPFGGGCAGGLKSGVSGGLDIPVTRHEMGHQFSQSHTINHPNNNNYETENGAWTIQGGNQQGHAHGVSYHQTSNLLVNSIPNKGTKISTGNTIPTVNAGSDHAIPISTPFTLTGTAVDTDLNDSLTYVWDNMNPGLPQSIPVGDDSQGAIFMRLLPDTISSRTFPKMSDVVANINANAQEQLPTQRRIMDIRLTVNDNHKMLYNGKMINASGTNSDDIQITVADAGPFEVTSQNTVGIVYDVWSNQMVTWNVNNTDLPPINTQSVKILLSVDGGYTYPIVLSQSTPNNGSAAVTIPDIPTTTTARIKVMPVDNIYFDINTKDFAIQQTTSTSEFDLIGNSINIYPNPAKESFTIDLPESMKFKTEIYGALGQLMMTEENVNTFDISKLSNGIYYVVVTDFDSNQKVRKKLIVSN
ncbi:T9SS type A sorting domain-containing protein [Brumimicrobium glaciale]|uniref:T9SS type A sorting domain-containing protein n=1 Tax=Brumimicrobium glaciale TaxID=200475 RepID=A0A4Q4KFF5_9FLAO|nr:zinc-dependent metalloprotease [Brumimicrobium glaciale]RYM31448.1 T9SS type A sorting domain-containing protein [Brumimicrobium glaciale]